MPGMDRPYEEGRWVQGGGTFMAVMMFLILGGGLPFFSYFFRPFTWIIWGLVLVTILGTALDMSYRRLLVPMLPYLAWLTFYFIWGLIVADDQDYAFAAKAMVTTVALACAVGLLLSSARALRSFANAAQFAVAVNILILLLSPFSSKLTAVMLAVTMRTGLLNVETYGRWGGLWGNPNAGGYICLLAMVLSVFATRWVAWMGRLISLPIIYFTASRRAGIFLVLVLVLYMVIAKRRDYKLWLMTILTTATLVIVFSLSRELNYEGRSVTRDRSVARILDVEEKDTTAKGGVTRLALFEEWSTQLNQEPWYGYGLQAMAGRRVDDDTMRVVSRGRIILGTHNTFLGVWIDIGPAGFLAFMVMIFYYLRICFTYNGQATLRWALVSLGLINLTYLFFSHSLLFSFEGQIAFAMMFLLPASPAFRELEWDPGILDL